MKDLERKITAVFPGKQSFFALFVLYANSPSLSMFLISGLLMTRLLIVELSAVVMELHASLQNPSMDGCFHIMSIQRIFAKLLGFLLFYPYWRQEQSPAKSLSIPAKCFFAYPPPNAVNCSLPLNLYEMATTSWKSGTFGAFLLWVSQLFYFVTAHMVECCPQLDSFFSFLSTTYQFVFKNSSDFRYSKNRPFNLNHQFVILLIDSFPIHISSPPVSTFSLSSSTVSSTVSRKFQSLVQAFDGRFADLASAVRSLQPSESNNGYLQLSARKIRPRDVDITAEFRDLLFSQDGFVRSFSAGTQVRSEGELHRSRLLQSYLKHHEEMKEIEPFLKLLTVLCARKFITKSVINEAMKTHYASFEALVERIDEVSHVILDYVNPQTVSSSTIGTNDPEIIQLQSAVECTIMKHLFSTITAEVMRALREGFGSTDWIRNSSIWQETVLRCMVDTIQYDSVRDDIHKSVLSMVVS